MRAMLVLVVASACGFQRGSLAASADAHDRPADAAESPDDAAPLVDACSGCPANDVPGGAQAITGTVQLAPVLGAANDDITPSCGTPGGRDLFYELVVPTQQVIYIDSLGAAGDTAIAVYAGPCVASPAELECSNDPCAPQRFAMLARTFAPGRYCLVVDEATGAPTSTRLEVWFLGRDGTQLVGTSPFVVSGDTCASVDASDPTCENQASTPGTAKDTMYWVLQCGGMRSVSASTCAGAGYDSIVYVQGLSGGQVCVDDGCGPNDSGSLVDATTSGTGLFKITVDGWNGACGTYTLTVNVQ